MANISSPSVVLGVCLHGAVEKMAVLDMVIQGIINIMSHTTVGINLNVSLCSSRDAPVQVQALVSVKVVMIAAGESHSAAITDKGALYTWGRGNYGRLGHGWHSNIITT